MQVLYEDNHLLIVNKPAGVLVQGDKTGDKPLVEYMKGYIKDKYHKPGNVYLGVVHRIDRPVSGVVIFARTSKALERMNRQFREQKMQKIYWALVDQRPPAEAGTLVHWLIKDRNRNVVRAFDKEQPNSLKATLDYHIIKITSERLLLEIRPLTGRPHQIRVQLSRMGSPIAGDVKYGYPKPNEDGNICLHARKLIFVHPVKPDRMVIQAPLPDSKLWNTFKEDDMSDNESVAKP
jgi:23S rRNA pseudouridine1911/1915/1917 synthase